MNIGVEQDTFSNQCTSKDNYYLVITHTFFAFCGEWCAVVDVRVLFGDATQQQRGHDIIHALKLYESDSLLLKL